MKFIPQPEPSRCALLLAALFLFCGAVILKAGLSSQVSLGDEVHHYDFARDSFVKGERAITHSLFPPLKAGSIHYVTDPGWPMTLASLWKILGRISFSAAQIYQTFFYLLLALSVYGLTRRWYSAEAAAWASLLALTSPMLVSFGILFYTDLPAAAMTAASCAFLIRRRYLLGGLFLAGAFYMKKTAILFCPGLGIGILYAERRDWKKNLTALLLYLGPLAAVMLHERAWQVEHLKGLSMPMVGQRLQDIYRGGVLDMFKNAEFSNSSLYKIGDYFKYFGIPVLTATVFYFAKRSWLKKDIALGLTAASYVAGVLFLRLIPDLRYFLPIAPLLCVIAGHVLAQTHNRCIKVVVVLLCLVQISSAAFYTMKQRTISPAVIEGFHFLKEKTPQGSVVIYPELNILEYAERPMLWGLFNIRKVFWGTKRARVKELEKYGVDYIAVLKTRVYDDAERRHIGGYPQSFLKKLPDLPFVELVFENKAMAIWEIRNLEQAASEVRFAT